MVGLRQKVAVYRYPHRSKKKLYNSCVNSNKLIYVHVPKAAGASITKALYGQDPWHHKLIDYEKLDPIKFKAYKKVAFVRNPIDRIVSAYLYGKKKSEFNRFSDLFFLRYYNDINVFITEWLVSNYLKHYFFLPQYVYLKNMAGRVELDFLGRFESLNEDFKKLAFFIGRELVLPEYNVNKDRRSSEYYLDSNSIDIIRHIYSDDFKVFDY